MAHQVRPSHADRQGFRPLAGLGAKLGELGVETVVLVLIGVQGLNPGSSGDARQVGAGRFQTCARAGPRSLAGERAGTLLSGGLHRSMANHGQAC
jgi:hypothetical protein